MSDMDPIFTNVNTVAAVLDVSTKQVYKLLDAGAIESQYIGRSRKVSVASLREYVANLPTSPEAAA